MTKPASRDLHVGDKIRYNYSGSQPHTDYTIIARKSDDSGWWLERGEPGAKTLHSGGVSDSGFDETERWEVVEPDIIEAGRALQDAFRSLATAVASGLHAYANQLDPHSITDHLPQVFIKPGAQIVIDSTDGPVLVRVEL